MFCCRLMKDELIDDVIFNLQMLGRGFITDYADTVPNNIAPQTNIFPLLRHEKGRWQTTQILLLAIRLLSAFSNVLGQWFLQP